MVEDEQTTTTDTPGTQTNTPVETPKEPTSLYDKTEAIVAEDKANLKKREELIKREETLFANQRLAGTTGGNVVAKEPEQISDKEYADKFMRGEANPLVEDGISLDS